MTRKSWLIGLSVLFILILVCLFYFRNSDAQVIKNEDFQSQVIKKLDKILNNQEKIFSRLDEIEKQVKARGK